MKRALVPLSEAPFGRRNEQPLRLCLHSSVATTSTPDSWKPVRPVSARLHKQQHLPLLHYERLLRRFSPAVLLGSLLGSVWGKKGGG